MTKSPRNSSAQTLAIKSYSDTLLGTIVGDILFDMDTRDPLTSGPGNAMLVTSSIYQARKIYKLFSKTHLAGKVPFQHDKNERINNVASRTRGDRRANEVYRAP